MTSRSAGPNSQTQNELWAAIATNGNSKAAGTPMTAMATAAFNNQSAALASRLRAQQSGGGGVQLSIASSIWTKDLAILPGYAALMKVQFGVSCCVGLVVWKHPAKVLAASRPGRRGVRPALPGCVHAPGGSQA